MSRPRTLIIGLDGATFDLIEPMARAGRLPTLSRLMSEGSYGPLWVWPNMNSAASWTSIVTGTNPGQHGIYDFGDAPPQRGQKWRPITGADRSKDPFWRPLGMAGQQVGVINIPITFPADPATGFMLSGMDAPGLHSPGFAHPPDLLDDLRRKGIDYILDVPNLGVSSQRDPHRLPASVPQMVDARARTILHLMRTRPWQVLMAVFVAPDRVQHYFWPAEEVPLEDRLWAPIRQVYQQIDANLADILQQVDEDTTVILVSDHGFGLAQFALDCLNPLFAHFGLLRYLEGGGRARGRLLRGILHYGRRIVPQRLQLRLAQVFPALRLRAISEHKYAGIDWPQTQVSATWGRVQVNLQGRQQEGVVPPEDYQILRERVRDILLKLTDPDTGHRLVRAVHWREDVYHGPYQDQASDLVIEWEDKALHDALRYDGEGEPVTFYAPRGGGRAGQIVGAHRPQGILIARGPNVKRGATVTDSSLYDIAPTILYLQGRPIPRDMDGKVLTAIFDKEHLHRHRVEYTEPSQTGGPRAETLLGEEDSRLIEERLRGLGYIE